MGLIEGLDAITSRIANDEARYSNSDYVKAEWFKLADKQAATVQFLQEFDKNNEAYSEKNGLAVMAIEHNHPTLWRNKALCTFDDEGRCYGCEQHQKNPKAGWKQKTKVYINALVDYGDGDPVVQVLSSGLGKGQVAPVLLEILKPEEGEDPISLTKTKFKVTRSGKGLSDTAYLVTQKGVTKNDTEVYELFDLHKVLRQIPYGEQEAAYNRGAVETEERELVSASSAPEEEW